MKHFLRPYTAFGLFALILLAPLAARAQARRVIQFFEHPSTLLLHSNSQGYLGVDLADVDPQKAQALRLREVRGAIITLIDHDAPAGQVGLRVNDVVVKLNGQTIESAEQLRRMLREIPAGRKVSIEISRDGNLQTLAVELGSGDDLFTVEPGMGLLPEAADAPLPGGFHIPFFGSSLNVGALVEPLTAQMADYLGVRGGLMVKQVARRSSAEAAGLRAFDVILRVGPHPIVSLGDWERALHANQGKPVPVTVLRDRRPQTLTLQVDSKRHG
jgi:S1-C subfamily serine protease